MWKPIKEKAWRVLLQRRCLGVIREWKMKEEKGIETPQSPEGFTGVQITPENQQLIGVKSDEAATRKLIRDIRTVGIIEADETKIARVSIKFSGWIKDMFVDYVGKYVKRGEPLFTVYSPQLAPA